MIHPIKSVKAHYQTWATKHFQFTRSSKQLKRIKDSHKGNICFIIGNGPSLKAEDLSKLYELGIPTFAANRVYKIFDKTKWRPTYYFCEDPIIIRDIEGDINEIVCPYKFIPIHLKWYYGIKIDNVHYFNLNYFRKIDDNISFCDDIHNKVIWTGTVTITAIQFAAYMGYTDIYLIGVDHSYSNMIDSDGNVVKDNTIKNYFDDSYDDGIKDELVHDLNDSTKMFYRAKQHFTTKGIHIYNATRGGRLEVFPRVNLDAFFMEHMYENSGKR